MMDSSFFFVSGCGLIDSLCVVVIYIGRLLVRLLVVTSKTETEILFIGEPHCFKYCLTFPDVGNTVLIC
jgi:hypothetical protein